ncbi:MAG: DUF3553 domain-containing protein, partial [Hyphomicrobiaceae bacterium]
PFSGAYANFGNAGGFGRSNPYGASRFDDVEAAPFRSSYQTPGWQRAQQWKPERNTAQRQKKRPLTLEGELVASSTGHTSDFSIGDRVRHQKFGYGEVTGVDGNKLTIEFEDAGQKRVVDSFVEKG